MITKIKTKNGERKIENFAEKKATIEKGGGASKVVEDGAGLTIEQMYKRLVTSGQMALTVGHATGGATTQERAEALIYDAVTIPQMWTNKEMKERADKMQTLQWKLNKAKYEEMIKKHDEEILALFMQKQQAQQAQQQVDNNIIN